mgnify:CR=1 FL=1
MKYLAITHPSDPGIIQVQITVEILDCPTPLHITEDEDKQYISQFVQQMTSCPCSVYTTDEFREQVQDMQKILGLL